jgi:predicted pyridoxine 5'-phosphate oxidase superfamily flavin-nucleotide-binding protein
MASMPESVRSAWEDRKGPVVLATVNADGVPNIIYASCVGAFGADRLVVADNYFDKTRANLQTPRTGSILFLTKEGKAFQVKGRLEYHTSGEVFDDMKTWNPPKHPGHGAAVLHVEEVYSGAEKIC